MVIGINTASSQSGRAYCVDLMSKGHRIIGYSRMSRTGISFVDAVNDNNGIYMDRPKNANNEKRHFYELKDSFIGHDLQRMIDNAEIIIMAMPSQYFVEAARKMVRCGLDKRRIPIVLSPGRTCSSLYMWKILGEGYPLISFSTCPYSCKAPDSNTAYIKRRKRNWVASLEGEFTTAQIEMLQSLFPQALFNSIPATTSIGNIGAVFHPATYLMNYKEITESGKCGKEFSFYMRGIADRKDVGYVLEKIDMMRLKIGEKLGLRVYYVNDDKNEEEWQGIIGRIKKREGDIHNTDELRLIRHDGLIELNYSIPSALHWLDYTYNVERIPGESYSDAIRRTPTYQVNSVPQLRYLDEDIATGLLPLSRIAERFGIDNSAAENILRLCEELYPERDKKNDRTMEEFSTKTLIEYLQGRYYKIIE